MKAKLAIARAIFDRHGPATIESSEFRGWFETNADWLKPYAAFCFLRDLFNTAEHWHWGALAAFSKATVERLCAPEAEYYRKIEFTYYVQVCGGGAAAVALMF